MRTTVVRTLGGLALTTLLATMAFAPAVGRAGVDGFWTKNFSPQQVQAECGSWSRDRNGFCVANDSRNGLEIGVKFRTSTTVRVTGIRIYRVDTATLHGSLWDSAGTLLARGTFASGEGHAWQDMSFAAPVTIVPGRTYVASYFTPGTKYAFDYWYFRDDSRTVGPVTALRSVDGEPNGVHCYDDAACGSFPVRPYRDSTYFVSPLWEAPDEATDPPTDPPTPTPTDSPTPNPGADTRAPRVETFRPPGISRHTRVETHVTVRFSESVSAASLTGSTVRLVRTGSVKPVRAALRYDAAHGRVIIDPRSRLLPRTTYRVIVTSRVRDLAGNRLDQAPTRGGLQDATSTFRTR